MNLKKIISAIAAAVTCTLASAAYLPADALDDLLMTGEELTDGTFTYELINGTYTITGCYTDAIIESIPELRNGYAITAIGDNALVECTKISKLTIPDTVTSIGNNAFAGCTSLSEIRLPNRLESISLGAFSGCINLKSVDIPDSVNTICSYAFYKCSNLTDVRLPGSLAKIDPMAFAECSLLEHFDATATPAFIFENDMLYNSAKTNIYRASTALTGDVYIEDGVTNIEPGAFSVCAGIENLFIPSSVRNIGEDAFGYCVSLKKVNFSLGLETIAPIAFKHCYSLQSVEFPSSLKSVGDGAFYNCLDLEQVIISDGVETIGTGTFMDCKSLKNVIVPASVKEIGENAFGFNSDDEGEYILNNDFSMSVYSSSAAEKYAKDSKVKYSVVDKSLKKLGFIVIAVGVLATVIVFAIVLMARGKKGAPAAAKKAEKEAKEKEEEENYESIL